MGNRWTMGLEDERNKFESKLSNYLLVQYRKHSLRYAGEYA